MPSVFGPDARYTVITFGGYFNCMLSHLATTSFCLKSSWHRANRQSIYLSKQGTCYCKMWITDNCFLDYRLQIVAPQQERCCIKLTSSKLWFQTLECGQICPAYVIILENLTQERKSRHACYFDDSKCLVWQFCQQRKEMAKSALLARQKMHF